MKNHLSIIKNGALPRTYVINQCRQDSAATQQMRSTLSRVQERMYEYLRNMQKYADWGIEDIMS